MSQRVEEERTVYEEDYKEIDRRIKEKSWGVWSQTLGENKVLQRRSTVPCIPRGQAVLGSSLFGAM